MTTPEKPERITLNDQQKETSLYRSRASLAGMIVLSLFSLLLVRYGWLQLVQHETYLTLSENNRIHLEAISPPRGFIYDRNGVLLADNRPVFALVVNRQTAGDLDALIARAKPVLQLSDEEGARFKKRLPVSRRFD